MPAGPVGVGHAEHRQALDGCAVEHPLSAQYAHAVGEAVREHDGQPQLGNATFAIRVQAGLANAPALLAVGTRPSISPVTGQSLGWAVNWLASAPPVTVAGLLPAGVQEVDPAVLEVLEQRVGAVNRDLGSAAVRRSLALALEANSFWAEAIAQYRLALGMDAADWDALLHLAGCLRQAGDLSGELDALERVVAARPDDRAALNRLAVARLDQGNLDGARELFRTLRSLLPEHPHGPLGLGQVELEAGNAEVALEHLARARALGPLVQGLDKPYMDLSRGCTADDVVLAAVVTPIQA